MPIELAGIPLNRIHKIVSQEQADFVAHRIPGLDGNVVQDMGRDSVVLYIEGIFYGATAKDDLEKLRDVYKGRKEVDFLADLVGQAYFSQVVVKKFEVWQRAEDPDQFSYVLTLAEYVPPPEPESDLGFPDVELDIGLEALDFMDMIQLPDLLSVPELSDPSAPLLTLVDGISETLNGMTAPAQELSGWYGGGTANKSIGRSARDASGPTSISANIEANVDAGQLLSMVASLVDKLAGSNVEIASLFESPPGGVDETGGFLSSLSPPDIDQSNVLQSAFGEITDLLPTDISFIIGPMTTAIDEFFGGLSINLTGDITRILRGFEAIVALTQTSFTLETDVGGTASKFAFRGPRAVGDATETIAALEQIRSFLERIPDPLDVSIFLETILKGLQALPRDRYPLRYLPLIDELRDKLESVLAWKEMDSGQLSMSIGLNVQALRGALYQLFFIEGIEDTATKVTELALHVNGDSLGETMDTLTTSLTTLAGMVQGGDLSAAQAEIDKLNEQKDLLTGDLLVLNANLLDGQIVSLQDELNVLGDEMNARMLQFIADLDPPSDLPILSILLKPLNELLDEIGFNDLLAQLHDVFGRITEFIDQLDLTALKDAFDSVIGGAADSINDLNETLIGATVELTTLMNQVENTIQAIGVAQLVATMKQALEGFQNLVEQGVETIFAPVRDVLLTSLTTIDDLLTQFSPALLVDELKKLLQILTGVLSNPQLLDALDTVKSSLDSANAELGKFSFKPVTDTVVQAIDVAGSALEIALSLPLPDSLRSELEDALSVLPQSLHPTADAINAALDDIVEEGPKPILEAIRDAPKELTALVESFSPSNFIGENLTRPYTEFLTTMENYTPGKLLEPIDTAIDDARETVRREADPEKLMQPLQAGFDEILAALDSLDPNALLEPLQEQLSQGIQTITDALPLDEANEVFDKINEVTGQFQQALNIGTTVRELLQDLHDRIAGLADAENQVRQFGDSIAAKFDTFDNSNPLANALLQLSEDLDKIKAAPLLQIIEAPLDAAITDLENLQPKAKLVSLVAAQRGFPRAALEALPDTSEKLSLLAFLDNFDPLAEEFSLPLNSIEDWKTDLVSAKTTIQNAFANWDARYFSPNSPLEALRLTDPSPEAIKTLLKDTIQQQLTETLAPLFRVIDHFSSFFAGILDEITQLVSDLQSRLANLLAAANTLDELRNSINGLVDTLENFDITFIADEVKDVFDAVKAQLEQISPAVIAAAVKVPFDNLLNLLDLNTLLGVDQLDDEYNQILENLRANDPTRLLAEVVQPEYDKIPAFLQRLDLSVQINTLIEILESLKVELEGELDRTADAYDAMIDVVPSDLQASLSVSASVSV
ncbi:MAG: DNA circularization N-terminal domain-containing protein [Saprospiraceae bacterium]